MDAEDEGYYNFYLLECIFKTPYCCTLAELTAQSTRFKHKSSYVTG